MTGENLGQSLEQDESLRTTENTAETQHEVDVAKETELTPMGKAGIDKEKRKIDRKSGVESYYRIKQTGVLKNEEIIEQTKDWAEGAGTDEKNLTETLKYFDKVDSIIDKRFPPEQKAEITCALAEIISDPEIGIDAETLEALSIKVVFKGSSGTMDRVCEYSRTLPGIKVYSELFDEIDGCDQNITHIISHEISHGLDKIGGVGQNEAVSKIIDESIGDADGLSSRESYRTINAIEQYKTATGKEGATEQEIEIMRTWLKDEIRAEKISAYLQSGNELGGFLNALWRVTPPESQNRLMRDKNSLDSWVEENTLYFQEIQKDMADKEALKKRIIENSRQLQEGRQYDENDFDFDEYFADSYHEPALPDPSKPTANSTAQKGPSLLDSAKEMFAVMAGKAEEVMPVQELAKKTA